MDSKAGVNPWPHLSDFIDFVSRSGPRVVFDCKLCMSKKTTVKAHISSLNNLKQHMRRAHVSKCAQFERTIKEGSGRGRLKRKVNITLSDKSANITITKKKKFDEEAVVPATGSTVSQASVEKCIINFFVTNMIPLHIVETKSFEQLIKTLNPSKSSLSQQTLGRRIIEEHIRLKQHLINLLGKIDMLATTADCWSAEDKKYLGMTVHWLDPVTRSRMHAVLSCITLKGQSYDVLAKAMIDIHYEFHIDKKITRVTHDNGRNFLKTFMQFSTESDSLPDLPPQDITLEPDDAVANLLKQSSEDNELEFISVDNMLTDPDRCQHNEDNILQNFNTLPIHMRCAVHTFNLVASKDADAALQISIFKIPYRIAMAKARALWYQQSSNLAAAAIIEAALERKLVVPSRHWWKSTYDAIVVLNAVLEKQKPTLIKVMAELKIETFNDQDVIFMKEYAKVMAPIAGAVDLIQGKAQAYLGTLLPTVAATVFKLKNIKSKGLENCTALANALLSGIDKRFGPLLDDEQCLLAAAFHPRFRLVWLEMYDISRVEQVRKLMEKNIEEALRHIPADSWKDTESVNDDTVRSSDEDDEEDFLNSVTQSKQKPISHSSFKAQSLLKMWLDMKSNNLFDDEAFLGEEVLINLFIKYNTAIPSSAAFESIVSTEKYTVTPKRGALSDENFNMLMFIKGNMHLNIHQDDEKPNCSLSS